jgi:hypothetical protein
MTEEIDYQAVAEGLQHDLEQARLDLMKLKYARSLYKIDFGAIRDFAQRNYIVLMLLIFATHALISVALEWRQKHV